MRKAKMQPLVLTDDEVLEEMGVVLKALDSVNHPAHYNTGKIEVIEFIEDQRLGFHLGNALKYISRAGKKDREKAREDLDKAIWYIRRFQETLRPESQRRRPNDMPQERSGAV